MSDVSLSLGIDVAEERKGLDLVALDGRRRVVATVAHATVADVVALVEELGPDVVCIDSPPAWAERGRSRTAERALRPLGISAYSTPADPGDHPFYRWMRAGFAVFDAVADTHPRYRTGSVRGTAAEVFPEATAVLLRGRLRAKDEPKLAFRRQILADNGVDPAPLRSQDAVDAALAALTGVLALDGSCCTVGDPAEGVILLPVATLPTSALVRPQPSGRTKDGAAVSVGADHVAADGPGATSGIDPAAGRIDRRCLCACGAPVQRRFLPGHDAKLKSELRRQRRVGEEAAARLRELGWD